MKTQKFKYHLAVFIALYGILWFFIGIGNFFSVLAVGENSKFVHLGFAVASAVLTAGIAILDRIKRNKNELELLTESIGSTIQSIKGELGRIREEGNVHKLRLIQWRFMTELEKVKRIHSGSWRLEAHPTYSYLRYVFGNVLDNLGHGDRYYALSNLDFWSWDKFGDSEFLELNIDAINRGVKITRIIVIDPEILVNPERAKERRNLVKLVEELRRARQRYPEFAAMDLKFYLSRNPETDFAEPIPYALIRNKEKLTFIKILPNLKTADGRVPNVRIVFAPSADEPEFRSLALSNSEDCA